MKLQTESKKRLKSTVDTSTEVALELIKEKNLKKEALFFFPSQYISSEAGLCAKLLNQTIIKKIRENSTQFYLTQYTNCQYEALNGALKIMRQNYAAEQRIGKGLIIIYDPKKRFSKIFNPSSLSLSESLVPYVYFLSDQNEVLEELSNKNVMGFIGFLDETAKNLNCINACIKKCKKRGIYTGVSEGYLNKWYKLSPTIQYVLKPDVFILGDNLTDSCLPFGAFLIKKNFYKPLNKISTALLNSSCFSGNTLTLSYILNSFKKFILNESSLNLNISDKLRFELYKKYVNPKIGLIYHKANIQPKIISAQGSQITYKCKGKLKSSYDFQSCAGSSSRGYNPKDIPNLIDSHNTNTDYHHKLEEKFKSISKYSYFFPSPSGSTAVDLAIILAYIAGGPDGYMITFEGNFSGKSLISINFSSSLKQQNLYRPLSSKVKVFDPFDPKITETLPHFLENNKVSFFLFELLRGDDMKVIPENVLKIITKYQIIKGYYLIIDEVLTGFFRTGNLFFSEQYPLVPNAIAIGKGTSDMTFPTAGALVDEKLYQAAFYHSPELVTSLYSCHKNQVGAHILYNNLKQHLLQNTPQKVKKSSSYFGAELKEIVKNSKLFAEAISYGHLHCLRLNTSSPIVFLLGEVNVEFIISKYLFKHTNLICLNLRFIPPLNISDEVLSKCLMQLKKHIPKLGFWTLLLLVLEIVLKISLDLTTSISKSKLFRFLKMNSNRFKSEKKSHR